MFEILINLLASAIAAAAAWTAQYLVRYRRVARQRAFFGVRAGADVRFFVSKHFSSPQPQSVHRNDVAALVELATTVRECGGHASLVTTDDGPREGGRVTEYTVGGPDTNPRTAAHLRSSLPGLRFGGREADPTWSLTFVVGDRTYRRRQGERDERFAVLARVHHPLSTNPTFVLSGQTALDNLAAARYLAGNFRRLFKQYGADRPFCLVLRVEEPAVFGADHVLLDADVTADAFVARPEPPAGDAPVAEPTPRPDPAPAV